MARVVAMLRESRKNVAISRTVGKVLSESGLSVKIAASSTSSEKLMLTINRKSSTKVGRGIRMIAKIVKRAMEKRRVLLLFNHAKAPLTGFDAGAVVLGSAMA